MGKGLDSDTIWTLQDRWINQTDADCDRMTQVKLLNILEQNGRENLDAYAEAAASEGPFSGRISAQIVSRIVRETGFNLSTVYWACKRWARGAGTDH